MIRARFRERMKLDVVRLAARELRAATKAPGFLRYEEASEVYEYVRGWPPASLRKFTRKVVVPPPTDTLPRNVERAAREREAYRPVREAREKRAQRATVADYRWMERIPRLKEFFGRRT